MNATSYTSSQLAQTIAEVIGELDAENPRLVAPAEIVSALQIQGYLPAVLPAGHRHEAGVLSWINMSPGYLSDSKCRTYQVRKKTSDTGQVLCISFR